MVRTRHRIGGYRVIAPIGAGGFATVYRALDEKTGQEVAIKVLAENHSLVADTRRRFIDEIDLLQTVDSPSIAKIYEVGETETGQPYMVLELADRGDLRRRLEEIRGSHQTLNRADLAMLAQHLHGSLTTLHRAEIIHRDVSPGNILIRSRRVPLQAPNTRNGEITLLEPGERFLLADLGHAKDMIRASGFTAGGGTKGFASPEQRDDITVVDLRADIFSATAVLEWAAHDGEYAEDLEPFFDTGLAEDPDDRFTSMTEWHAAFSAALEASGTSNEGRFSRFTKRTEQTKQTEQAKQGDGATKRFGRKRLAVTAAAVVLGLATTYTYLQLEDSTDDPNRISASRLASRTVAVSTSQERDTLEVVPGATSQDSDPSAPAGSNLDDDEGSQSPEAETTTTETELTTGPPTTETSETTATAADTTTTDSEQTVTAAPDETTTSTANDGATTTVQTQPTTTQPSPSGEQRVSAVTDQPTPEPEPAVFIESPNERTELEDILEISGSAQFFDELGTVELIFSNLASNQFWSSETKRFQDEVRMSVLPVDGDPADSRWSLQIPSEQLEPNTYYGIWVRAKGVNGENSRIQTRVVLLTA